MFDHADLHRHDFKLLADLLADGVFAAAAGTGQFTLGQFVDDFDAGEIGRQRLALAAPLGRRNSLFFCAFINGVDDAFRLIEQGQLRRCRISRLLGLASEQALTQQRIFFFEETDSGLHLRKHLLEQFRIIGEVFGHGNHALDYTESGHVSRRQNLMRTVAPQIKTIK
ncbi:hypothetical protein D3C71_1474580 [compost metagenome]